jgi:hypothetical protein
MVDELVGRAFWTVLLAGRCTPGTVGPCLLAPLLSVASYLQGAEESYRLAVLHHIWDAKVGVVVWPNSTVTGGALYALVQRSKVHTVALEWRCFIGGYVFLPLLAVAPKYMGGVLHNVGT